VVLEEKICSRTSSKGGMRICAYGWMATRSLNAGMVTTFEIGMEKNGMVERYPARRDGQATLLIHSLVGRLHCY
jgi:hypothetical protein